MSSIRFFVTALLLVVLDQITKVAVKGFNFLGFTHDGMYLGESVPILGDTIRLTFVENPGMAFGISFGAGKIVLTLATFAIAAAISWYLHRSAAVGAKPLVLWAVTLVLAGAVGNLIDRTFYGVFYNEGALFYGRVVDFIQVDIPDVTIFNDVWTHWPVFNVADSCVSVGIVTLLFLSNHMPAISSIKRTHLPSSVGTTDSSSQHVTGSGDRHV